MHILIPYPYINSLLSGIRFDGDGVGHGCGREAYLGFNVGWSIRGNSELAPKVMMKFVDCDVCALGCFISDTLKKK